MGAVANTAVYTDFSALTELKARASNNAEGSLSEVARQFESLFMGQMLKSMRQASLGEGILDSDQSLFYRDMFDQQLALHLSESGGMGLAAAIERQLGSGEGGSTGKVKGMSDYLRQRTLLIERPLAPSESTSSNEAIAPDAAANPADWNPQEFVQQLWPWALEAAKQLGLRPQALLAQSALETGWGQHMLRQNDGSPSYNLFNIKADKRWDGDRVAVSSLEYEGGVAVKKRDHFRAYDSLRDSFHDYVAFLKDNPRYREALESVANPGRYFSALQQAGYATDPRYAEKIQAVLEGPEMQRALAGLGI